ncbi:MAG TPA: LuxR C-terminal-related transcriptional regulator [Streptosporangiaceae bacterium]|nr:LuxR C-terminal-related transcriptional regulator [Streptosporangiaceae bacterium]
MQRGGQARLAAAGVTAREAEILAAIGQRLSNREIADRMVISVRTVESHISALLRKLGLPGRPALADFARRLEAEQVLPLSLTSFVGRDDELAGLGEVLAAGPLVCLVGPAGCGKTRLALEAARRWRGAVRMVDLAPAGEADVGVLIAGALGGGYQASDLSGMVAAARIALAGTETLLVADNCEHVAGATGEALSALARGIPALHVLATSRTPLGLDAEQVVPLLPLPLPAGTTLEEVRASAAGRLFLDRALAASPRFRLDQASAPHVAAICHRLDGLPLAIELAAARVGHLGVAELIGSLRHRLDTLDRAAGADRHRSLSSAIAWSWQLLDDAGRSLLGRLAALPGEFTLALVEAVGPGPDPRPVLLRLVEQSLVSMRLPPEGPARYRLLEVIRAFAREQAEPGAADQVLREHARYFRDVAADAVRARYHHAPAAAPRADFDEANLLAALAWAAGHDPALADRLLVSASQLIETEPSRPGLELIRDIASRHPPQWSSEALAWASLVVKYMSLADAERLARRSAQAAVSVRDEALAGLAVGWVHAHHQDESAAVRCLDRTISYAATAPDPWLEGFALQARGRARAALGEAFADWEQAVTRFVVAGDLLHANNVRFMLADRAVDARVRVSDVPVWLDECETYAAGHGFRHELAHVRLARAKYQRIRGDSGASRPLLDAALPVFRQAGDFRCTARTFLELAGLRAACEPAAARDLLLQGVPAAAITRDPILQAQILARLMTAGAAVGDLVLAARCRGALAALGQPAPADPAGPAYATFVSEGRAGGIDLISTLYPPQ